MQYINRLGICIIFLALQRPAFSVALDTTCFWNKTLVTEIQKDSIAPPYVARSLAILHLAIHSAYRMDQNTSDAVVHLIAYKACTSMFPGHETAFETHLRKVYPDRVPDADRQFADNCVNATLDRFLADNSASHVSYVPREAPGAWRRTAPFFRAPEMPHWPLVLPILLSKGDQFRPAGPPPLNSKKFQEALREVREIGAKESLRRKPEETEIAQFWSDFSYTETPVGHWNSIARQIATGQQFRPVECARLFCMLNVALADTALACWDAKYAYEFWRPITAIQQGGGETAPLTWEPLLNTPSHPEYVSGHSAFSGAASTVLKTVLGRDSVEFTVASDTLPSVTKTYKSLESCALECGESRIYGGIHFRFSCEDGFALGKKVAEWTWGHFDQGKQ